MKKITLLFVLLFFISVQGKDKVQVISKDVFKLSGYSNSFGIDKYDPNSYKIIRIQIPKNTYQWYYSIRVIDDRDGAFNIVANWFISISSYCDPSGFSRAMLEIGKSFVNHISPEDCNIYLMKSDPVFNNFSSYYVPNMDLEKLDCFKDFSINKTNNQTFKIEKKYNEETFRYIVVANNNILENITVEIDAAALIKQ